jgi:TonB family protein
MRQWAISFVVAHLAAGAAAAEAPAGRGAPPPELVSAPNEKDFYTKKLRDAGESGNMRVKACIDDTGRITEVAMLDSSGFERLDEAALRYVQKFRFKPAVVDGVPVGGCYGVPVAFLPPPAPDPAQPQVVSHPDLRDYYPLAALRELRGGTVRIRLCFDPKGKVVETGVEQSSGFQDLDEAGLRAGMKYRIKPGVENGKSQPGCTIAPMRFLVSLPN